MKPISLYHFVIAYSQLEPSQCDKLYEIWGVKPKHHEKETVKQLVERFIKLSPYEKTPILRIFDYCYLGFSIPRISKEFDCLWISDKTVLNIELKSNSVGEEEVKKQLIKNKYYLKTLGLNIAQYTFDAQAGKFFTLDSSEAIKEITIKELGRSLDAIHKEDLYSGEIEYLFAVEKYLVSPFNATDRFLNKEYFLNDQQQQIKDNIVKLFQQGGSVCCAVCGGPGSGKTLLLYDIARTMMEKEVNVLIGQAGGLNQGHEKLKELGWNILPTNRFVSHPFKGEPFVNKEADIYIVDEAQRCPDVGTIYNSAISQGKKCLFSFDTDQVMSDVEKKHNNGSRISSYAGKNCFRLTTNIRTNQAVYEFIRAIFDLRCSVNQSNMANVEISYCEEMADLQSTLKVLKEKEYLVPKYTPGKHSKLFYEDWILTNEPSAHEVIGQEFDNVAGVITPDLYYDDNKKLVTSQETLYLVDRMLYQILSRARKKIHVVVYSNPVVLNRCMAMIKR